MRAARVLRGVAGILALVALATSQTCELWQGAVLHPQCRCARTSWSWILSRAPTRIYGVTRSGFTRSRSFVRRRSNHLDPSGDPVECAPYLSGRTVYLYGNLTQTATADTIRSLVKRIDTQVPIAACKNASLPFTCKSAFPRCVVVNDTQGEGAFSAWPFPL